jgi:hypothetical protein
MATRQIKMPAKDAADEELDEPYSQRKRPEVRRYLLQVDRQTKSSYEALDEAQKAGSAIKQRFAALQVSIYDRIESVNTLIS